MYMCSIKEFCSLIFPFARYEFSYDESHFPLNVLVLFRDTFSMDSTDAILDLYLFLFFVFRTDGFSRIDANHYKYSKCVTSDDTSGKISISDHQRLQRGGRYR